MNKTKNLSGVVFAFGLLKGTLVLIFKNTRWPIDQLLLTVLYSYCRNPLCLSWRGQYYSNNIYLYDSTDSIEYKKMPKINQCVLSYELFGSWPNHFMIKFVFFVQASVNEISCWWLEWFIPSLSLYKNRNNITPKKEQDIYLKYLLRISGLF